jgi:hypothetical protein
VFLTRIKAYENFKIFLQGNTRDKTTVNNITGIAVLQSETCQKHHAKMPVPYR